MFVIPAKAGIQRLSGVQRAISASAGMTTGRREFRNLQWIGKRGPLRALLRVTNGAVFLQTRESAQRGRFGNGGEALYLAPIPKAAVVAPSLTPERYNPERYGNLMPFGCSSLSHPGTLQSQVPRDGGVGKL